jgi:RNA polymerase sigma-70 factor (ECF subfamily)
MREELVCIITDMRRATVMLCPRPRRLAVRVARLTIEVDDLVQSACERALSHGHQWESELRLGSWLYRIIRNRWSDDRRSSRVRPTVPLNEAENLSACSGERNVEARLTMEAVGRALDKLPEGQRVVLVLACFEGLPYGKFLPYRESLRAPSRAGSSGPDWR